MISTGQTDCLPFVTEKFVILLRFTRIMTQCKNASPPPKYMYHLEITVLFKRTYFKGLGVSVREV